MNQNFLESGKGLHVMKQEMVQLNSTSLLRNISDGQFYFEALDMSIEAIKK